MNQKSPAQIPARGEVWTAGLDPTRGTEQKGYRPVLIVSIDELNRAAVQRTVVIPITSKGNHYPFRVALRPSDAGLDVGWLLCDQIRTISTTRLEKRCGDISPETLAAVEEQLALLLAL